MYQRFYPQLSKRPNGGDWKISDSAPLFALLILLGGFACVVGLIVLLIWLVG